jgi:hypothetical protein
LTAKVYLAGKISALLIESSGTRIEKEEESCLGERAMRLGPRCANQ